MTWEERMRYLLRAALRAESEGDRKVAETLRRMAREVVPLEISPPASTLDVAVVCCSE